LKNKSSIEAKTRRGLLFYSREYAGTTRNLEANLAACNDNVKANKQLNQ